MTLCQCSEYLKSNKENFLLCSFAFDTGSSLLSDLLKLEEKKKLACVLNAKFGM